MLRFRDQWRCDGFIRVMLDSREALMSVVELIQTIESLTPQQQEAVSAFVHYLKNPKTSAGSPFVHAAEEFMDEHPELMRLLAN